MTSISAPPKAELVATPTGPWLVERARRCRSALLIASPYINSGLFNVTNALGPSVDVKLITKTDMRDFALGSSDLNTLCTLVESGTRLFALTNLHAKVYVFDSTTALVTSANATNGGLYNNWECGLGISDAETVRAIHRSAMSGFGARRPLRPVDHLELASIKAALASLKIVFPTLKLSSTKPSNIIDSNLPEFTLVESATLLESFSGWRRLTLQGVLAVSRATFVMKDLLDVCTPLAQEQYPTNNFVRAKLRQQLQELRDLGLVEFLGNGRYKRTLNKK
ncbi:MAG: phospholipase D-like domain-containing protein [Chloroflexi bacterium]|nr:phospholipase D-like domain-containing protein [Chloroflexota bacterium]